MDGDPVAVKSIPVDPLVASKGCKRTKKKKIQPKVDKQTIIQ